MNCCFKKKIKIKMTKVKEFHKFWWLRDKYFTILNGRFPILNRPSMLFLWVHHYPSWSSPVVFLRDILQKASNKGMGGRKGGGCQNKRGSTNLCRVLGVNPIDLFFEQPLWTSLRRGGFGRVRMVHTKLMRHGNFYIRQTRSVQGRNFSCRSHKKFIVNSPLRNIKHLLCGNFMGFSDLSLLTRCFS